ncbi:MAG: hypothetical protein H6741_16055 [Alphaproteobacteria bacterium]|nr:hypothetical protein [Alphaproteobacteria bacterium]MCB9794228.1 hypothetical protein [Alphaproteobacteria bacterium]
MRADLLLRTLLCACALAACSEPSHPGTVTFVDDVHGTVEVKPVDQVPEELAWAEVGGVRKPVVRRRLFWHFNHYRVSTSGPDGEWLGTGVSAPIPLKDLVLDPDTQPAQLRFRTEDELFFARLYAVRERDAATPCVPAETPEEGQHPGCIRIRDTRVDTEALASIEGLPEGMLWDSEGAPITECTFTRYRWLDEASCQSPGGGPPKRALVLYEEAPPVDLKEERKVLVVDTDLGLQWEQKPRTWMVRQFWFSLRDGDVPIARIEQHQEGDRAIHDRYTEDGLFLGTQSFIVRLDPPADATPIPDAKD